MEENVKLLVDVRTMGNRPSGVGMYIFSYLKQLLLNPDVEIIMVSDVAESQEIRYLEEKGVNSYLYGKIVNKSVGIYSYFSFVKKIMYRTQPDYFWEPNNLIPVKMKNPYGKIILTIHDFFPMTMPECFSKIYRMYFRFSMGISVRSTDIFFLDSKETKKNLDDFYPVSKNKQKYLCYVIVEKMESLEIQDKDYFLYVGNLEKRKGTDLLLKAYKKYYENGGRKYLYLAGKMRDSEIQKLYEEYAGEIDTIKYIGYLSVEEKMRMYAECSCFVFPSRAEGFGMPPIEVMYYGKPVIVTELSIFREILGDSVNYVKKCENEQSLIDSLAEMMLHYKNADLEKYSCTIKKYSDERLGKKCADYLSEDFEKRNP